MTLIGDVPFAPAADYNIGTIDTAAYSSFEVDIFCASGSLPYDNWMTILHVTSGTNYGEIGSRVFAFWREGAGDSLYIGSPGTTGAFGYHTCVANTYSNYKITVSPDDTDDIVVCTTK